MIYVIIGTKGQFVKMAPVLQELDKNKLNYTFIHTGQHTKITDELINNFKLRQPDFYLQKRSKDVDNIPSLISWFWSCLFNAVINKNKIVKDKGVCLIHGDTESTLLGLIISKMYGLKVAHVEAGLRSYDLFNPFPEEIIRRITTKYSDYLFAPSKWAANNLKKEKIKGQIFNTKVNTVFDAVKYSINAKKNIKYPKKPYVLALFHRKETLFSKKKTEFAVQVLGEISKKFNTLFVCHKLTERKLKKYNLMKKIINNKRIVIYNNYIDYITFMNLVKNSEFVVADGGGLQEETTFLNKPCLLIRKVTERKEGLGETEYLAKFDWNNVHSFLKNYASFKTKAVQNYSPSKYIYTVLKTKIEVR
jgi:UDP-N-acetylglucosamine 2-epimerase (non-hydrolysing)